MDKRLIQSFLVILILASAVFLSANVVQVKALNVGVKVGDWVKYGVSGNSTELAGIDWIKIEITKVDGNNVSANVSGRWLNGTEYPSEAVDFVVGSEGEFEGIGFIIPANQKLGDSIYFGGEAVNITEATTRTYGGASRTVVGINYSIPEYVEAHALVFWDKTTGLLLELSMRTLGQSLDLVASSMSMGGSGGLPGTDVLGEGPLGIGWLIWIIIIAVIIIAIAAIALLLRRGKRAPMTGLPSETPPPPPPPSPQ